MRLDGRLSQQKSDASRLLLAFIGVLIVLVTFWSTTGAADVVHAYDSATVACVDDRAFATVETTSALANGVRDAA